MEKEFVTYEVAKKLKELGFNEECFGAFNSKREISWGFIRYTSQNEFEALAPLWQQVFDWFRKEKGIIILVDEILGYRANVHSNKAIELHPDTWFGGFISYEQARERAVLKALELLKVLEY